MKTPRHIAFIMDGNRRWAKSHALQILLGHDKGAHQIEPLVEFASKQAVQYVTFWAFSTENWNRDATEVGMLMQVFRNLFKDPMVTRMKKNNVKFGVIGDTSKFPEDIQEDLKKLLEETKENKKITVTIALNYGGREEILQAVNAALSAKRSTLSEEEFSNLLYTKDIPDPDLVIRTGGEKRLSGYLPWQTAYAELYFSDVLWPDFDADELQKALDDYALRERRFGK